MNNESPSNIMEKKTCQLNSSSLKNNSSTDLSRNKQDGGGPSSKSNSNNQVGKLHSRSRQRRVSPTSSSNANASFVRHDGPGRNRIPPKNQSSEKKPRPRNQNSKSVAVKDEPELGSVQTPGSKKQNLNHLLNFHFTPRESSRASVAVPWRSYNSHAGGTWRNRHHSAVPQVNRPKFNKEQFLQSNCQFMVTDTGNYSVHEADPDIMVDWTLVEQIVIRTLGDCPNCPICLEPPVAAKMTRCGHIFCWPCLLHYLALSDEKFRKCPICFDLVHKQDLKSVVAKYCFDINVGEEIELQLMVCPKDSCVAKPLMCVSGAGFDWENSFSKLLVLPADEVKQSILDREFKELMEKYEADVTCPEICFVDQALTELKERYKLNASAVKDASPKEDSDVLSALRGRSVGHDSIEAVVFDIVVDDSADVVSVPDRSAQESPPGIAKQRSSSESSDSPFGSGSGSDDESVGFRPSERDGHFYFYQAADGQNMFLHPLNMAMLWKCFGPEPTKWPQIIELRVLEKECVTITDSSKSRLRSLRHLPTATVIQLLEVELKPVVPPEIFNDFSAQLEARRQWRVKRLRDEHRRDRRIEAEERKKCVLTCPKIEIASTLDFPACGGFMDDVPLSPIAEAALEIPVPTNESSADSNDLTKLSTSPSSMSFAQIVSKKSTVKRSPTFPVTGNAWGQKPGGTSTPQAASHRRHSDSEPDPDDYTAVPEYRLSVSDAIAKALAAVKVSDEAVEPEGQSNGSDNKRKKKKGKGKVLFATGMECSN